jgi:type IV pilus assembly protein PilA
MKKMNKKGFTIVELVIVIAVIAILAAVIVPTFSTVVTKANESKALQEVRNAYNATLANDLATADTSDDVVYNKGTIKVIVGDYLVTITENGSATVAKTTDIASHEIDSATGLLKAASGS